MEIQLMVGLAIAVAVFILVAISVYNYMLRVGRPNEVLIISGRREELAGGGSTGYRLIKDGKRGFHVPFLEEVNRLDLTVMPVHINIQGAYSNGGIPLNVQAVANVKVDSGPHMGNAIERFLGRGRREIMRVAQETLEGNLRGVLATLTPEEVNESRLEFAKRLAETAEPDLHGLGLHMDTLKIQNVSDDRDYLDSIGRKQIAEILKIAEVAESRSVRTAEEREAEAQGRGEVARRQAQAEIQRKQNALRELEAELELRARSEEERAEARGLAARAEAEQELQQVRTELEKIRLQADVVIPAEAEKVARELLAAGEAAEIAERGRAMAQVLRMMTEVWRDAGDAAMDVFVLQRMEQVMSKVSDAARQVEVREVALIDGGSGQTLPNYVSSFPGIVGGLFKEMRDTVGIDIGGVLTGERGPGGGGDGGSSPGNGESGGSDGGGGRVEKKARHKTLASKLGKSKEAGKSDPTAKSKKSDVASQKTIRTSFLKADQDKADQRPKGPGEDT